MADDSAKPAEGAELSKDVLAPAEGPRENLVATAVKFLQNPKVRQSPLSQKKTFLESKGLTSDEIQLAVQRAGVGEETESSQHALLPPQPGQAYPPNTALMPPQPPLPPPLPVSPWTRTKEIVTTAAIVAAVSYAVYNVFKTYIRPWLMGRNETEARLQRLETSIAQLQASVAEGNAQMVETLRAIQESLTAQKETSAQSSEIGYRQETRALNEVKAEVTSLKSLLLNRRQFPPPPVTSPIIPSWQKSAVINSGTKSAASEQQSETASGGEATSTEPNTAQPAQGQGDKSAMQAASESGPPLFSARPEEEDNLSLLTPSPPEASTLASPANSNNGFEMVKPASDPDIPADLD